MTALIVVLTGLSVGSFTAATAWRLEKNVSIFRRSRCTSCEALIRPMDMIPLISFYVLRGKCRTCHSRFSGAYPLIEGLTAVLFLLSFTMNGYSLETLRFWAAGFLVVASGQIDYRIGVIPNRLVLAASAIGLVIATFGGSLHLIESAASATTLALIVLAVRWSGFWLRKTPGMGMGDVKLLFALGLILGWNAAVVLWLAIMCGAIFGGVQLLRRAIEPGQRIPFAPFVCAGFVLYLLMTFYDVQPFAFFIPRG